MKNEFKRLWLLAIMMCATFSSSAHDFEKNSIYYNIISSYYSYEVSVTYRGSYSSSYENEYSGSVTIPESVTYNSKTYYVTSIGDYAFLDCSGLTSVTIPNSVTSIGDAAFAGCSGLKSIAIPNSVTNIGYQAFSSCSGIETIVVNSGNTVYNSREGCNAIIETASNTLIAGCKNTTIPNSVTSIGDAAFYKCSGLTSIAIPNSVTSIGDAAFAGCSGLKSVTIGNSVTSIGQSAFSDCIDLTSVIIPNSVTSISASAFWNCSGLTSVNIGNSVTSIGQSAFSDCIDLTSVIIPNSVTSISASAFWNCSGLTSVNIGNSVTSISPSAFGQCIGLETIVVNSGNTLYDSREGCNAIVETASNTLIVGCKKTIIPNSVTSIGDYAFYWCKGLTSIIIPNSVTSIGNQAFSRCSGLTSVTIGNSVTSIGDWAFYGCSGLTSIEIPNCVTSIGLSAFAYCSDLTSIIIPNSVTSIGNSAFAWCTGLPSIIIPNSVTSIGNQAFSGCSGLESIIVSSGNTIYDSREGCNAIIETASNKLIRGCKNTIIPNSVNSIGYGAFDYCNSLTSITIPSSVTNIGDYVFYACSGLSNMYCYAENIPTTETNTFNNTDISNVTLHVPAESLDDYAATAPWSEFGSIEAIVLKTVVALTDGATIANDTDEDVDELSYTRTFSNTNWQALYVPFEMQYEDWKDDFEVARINNVNQYDDDEDGNVDRTVLEVFKVKSGQTEAHTPYLIKAKTTGEKTISLTNATLYKAEEKSYDVSSWNTLYTFTGTYTGVSGATMFGEGYYALGGGSLHQAADATNALSPMRWYMAVTDRDGNPKNIGEVKVVVFGMEEDGIEDVKWQLSNGKCEMSNGDEPVFDLNGRRVTNPRKGLYIKNGKKFVVR